MLLKLRKLAASGDFSRDAEVRTQYGVLSGIAGIILNILLFGAKLAVALVSGSVSVIADAFNNLSDVGSSVVTLVGFKISGKRPDLEHPYGHGRAEYVTGLIVSIVVIVMGLELALTSVRDIGGDAPTLSTAGIVVLAVSLAVKLYMAAYNFRYAKYFRSAAFRATGIDSLSDCAATAAVLVCLIISRYTALNLDGYVGVAVSALIVYSGVVSAKETLEPLLGAAPDRDFVEKIDKIILSRPVVLGYHDLVVHDYGPGRCMISVHVELPAHEDICTAHGIIDGIERDIMQSLNCDAVIHLDPVDTENYEELGNKVAVSCIAAQVDSRVTIHDFRETVEGETSYLSFDILAPFDLKLSDGEIISRIKRMVEERLPNHVCDIRCDRAAGE